MSNIVNFRGQKVSSKFSHIDPNKGLGEGVQGGFPILNYRGKNWTLKYQGTSYNFTREDDGSQLSYLDVIIVGDPSYISKIYFGPDPWDEDSSGPPICSSVKGDKPDPGVPEPQSKTCVSCSHYGWTTLPNGRKGKECQDHKRLAVLLMPKVTKRMLGAPLTEPVYLKIPPASLIPLKAYGDMLRHEGYPYCSVITRISFSSDKDKMFHMVFDGKQVLSDKEADFVLPLLEDPRTKRIMGEGFSAVREIEPPPVKPAISQSSNRIDTGLEDAFGSTEESEESEEPTTEQKVEIIQPPVKRGRGRPPKAASQVVIDNDDGGVFTPAAKTAAKTAASTEEEDTDLNFNDEGDDDLDAEVKSVLNTKTENMMK